MIAEKLELATTSKIRLWVVISPDFTLYQNPIFCPKILFYTKITKWHNVHTNLGQNSSQKPIEFNISLIFHKLNNWKKQRKVLSGIRTHDLNGYLSVLYPKRHNHSATEASLQRRVERVIHKLWSDYFSLVLDFLALIITKFGIVLDTRTVVPH